MKRLKREKKNEFLLAKNFIESIKKDEKILIIHDKDLDGICSGIILIKTLEKIGIGKIYSRPLSIRDILEKNELEKLNFKKFSKIIVLDLAIYQAQKNSKFFEKDILIIDHHPIFPKLKNKRIVLLNPRKKHPEIYQPTSYITYKFCSALTYIKDLEWLAVLGTIADYGYEDCKDLLKKYVRIKKKDCLWRTKFGKSANLLSAYISIFGEKKAFDFLKKCENINEILKNEKLKATFEKYKKLIKIKEEEFWKNAEIFPELNLIFAIISKKKEISGSVIASKVSTKNPDKIIILLEKSDGYFKIHGRNQSGRIHMGNLLRYSTLSRGGGHREAGGASINVKDLESFKKRFINKLKRNKVKI
ncbi:MAG: DHHA1 domain-containing protein [Candidatus Aenigmatarchaeota archaeon]